MEGGREKKRKEKCALLWLREYSRPLRWSQGGSYILKASPKILMTRQVLLEPHFQTLYQLWLLLLILLLTWLYFSAQVIYLKRKIIAIKIFMQQFWEWKAKSLCQNYLCTLTIILVFSQITNWNTSQHFMHWKKSLHNLYFI